MNKEQEKEECPHWKCNGCRKCGGWAENPDIEKSCYFNDCECHSKCNCQEICDGECSIVEPYGFVPNTGCPRHDMPFINKEKVEQCFCKSYYDDNNVLKDCTCGKCSLPPEEKLSIESWEKGYMEYEDVKEIKEFIKQKLSSHNARLIERVNNRLLDEDVNDHLSDDQIGYILQIIKEEQL